MLHAHTPSTVRARFARTVGFGTLITTTIAFLAFPRHSAGAQAPLRVDTTPSSERTLTAAEEARSLYIYPLTGLVSNTGERIWGAMGDDGADLQPSPELDPTIAQRAKNWVVSLEKSPAKGLQMDPMGALYVAAGNETAAQRQFAERLATRGLSLRDQAYTLLMAISAFGAKGTDTARMQIAEAYVKKLDAMPRELSFEQFQGHQVISDSYYLAGSDTPVIAHLKKAMTLVPAIPFQRRWWYLGMPSSIGQTFVELSDVLSGQPSGRAEIDSIGKWLMQFTKTPPELLAHDTPDSLAYKAGIENAGAFNSVLQMTSHFGQQAPPVTANFWWNTATPATTSTAAKGARSRSFSDGIIRVTEYGHYGCPGCLAALPKLERMRKAAPSGVEMWYVSDGNGGAWGNTPCTTEEEAQHLKHYYLERKQYGMPIALFVGDRRNDPDGGSGQEGSPTFAAYPIQGYPWFVVTDGKGIVRHISFGFDETRLTNIYKYLVAEAARAAH